MNKEAELSVTTELETLGSLEEEPPSKRDFSKAIGSDLEDEPPVPPPPTEPVSGLSRIATGTTGGGNSAIESPLLRNWLSSSLSPLGNRLSSS
jgi:hypothetical protein